MASNAMNTTQLACWIPEYQAAKALSALEKQLIVGKTVWLDWRSQLKYGDTLNIAIMPNLGTADSVNLNTDLTLNAQNTTRKQVIINQWNYKSVGVGYREQLQNMPEYLTKATEKCMYSCATAVDVYLSTLFTSLTAGNVGTQGSALTDDVMLSAVEYLAAADVPDDDRHLVLDVESITDLLKIDKFLRDDYVAKGAVENPVGGLIGRSVYGGKVWRSNNLTAANTTYHWAAMMHREAIALIMQKEPMVDAFDWKEKFTNVVRAQVIFGAAVVRPTSGCLINTRS